MSKACTVPLEKEPYGFAHLTKRKGILVLRNPNAIKQTVSVRLTADLGDIDPGAKYYVKVIYPYNLILPAPVKMSESVSVDLDGYEVLTAELIPADNIDKNLPVGVKYLYRSREARCLWRNRQENDHRVG